MKIICSLRHFDSSMSHQDIEEYLTKKFSFLERSIDDDQIVEFKVKKKNPRMNKEVKLPKHVYEVRVSGKLKTGDSFTYIKESVDLKKAIDTLASTVKEDCDQKVRKKQNRKVIKHSKLGAEEMLSED